MLLKYSVEVEFHGRVILRCAVESVGKRNISGCNNLRCDHFLDLSFVATHGTCRSPLEACTFGAVSDKHLTVGPPRKRRVGGGVERHNVALSRQDPEFSRANPVGCKLFSSD